MNLYYLRGPNVITRVLLISERGKQRSWHCHAAGFEDGRRVEKLEEVRKQIHLKIPHRKNATFQYFDFCPMRYVLEF